MADSYSYVPEDQPQRLAELIADFARAPRASFSAPSVADAGTGGAENR